MSTRKFGRNGWESSKNATVAMSGARAMVGMGLDRRGTKHEVRRRLDKPPGEERFDLRKPVAGAAIGNAALMHYPAAERLERPLRLRNPRGRDPPALFLVPRTRRAVRHEDDVHAGPALEEIREGASAAEDFVVRVRRENENALPRKRGCRVRHQGPLIGKIR